MGWAVKRLGGHLGSAGIGHDTTNLPVLFVFLSPTKKSGRNSAVDDCEGQEVSCLDICSEVDRSGRLGYREG